MKVVFLLAVALFGVVFPEQAEQKYFLYENEHGEIVMEDLTGEPDLNASPSDLTYHFYSQQNPTNGIIVKSTDVSVLRNTAFSASKDTIFLIDGWQSSYESNMNYIIRSDIIRGHDLNIFVVDWSPVAGKDYVSAQGSVKAVGEFIGEFVRSLVEVFGLRLRNVKFVGHSLGAHISGNAGAALNGQVDRIVGLDPAGPLFTAKNTDNRLDPTDAHFVQAIHTNGGLLGYKDVLGHSDYYPNGGRSQPGCGLDLAGSCAHSRSYAFYAESLNSNKFIALSCDSYSSYTGGYCDTHTTSKMGMFLVDTKASGTYFLTTNSQSPYAEG